MGRKYEASIDDTINEICKLNAIQKIRVQVTYSTLSGVVVGTATAVSGILGGPLGLAVGGIISSCTVGYLTKGQYEPVHKILLNCTPKEKEELWSLLKKLFTYQNIRNIKELRDNLSCIAFTKLVVDLVRKFLMSLNNVSLENECV